MTFFKILWAFDALAAMVIIYFFVVGLADGTVSSRNMALWMGIDAALAIVLLGSIWLQHNQHTALAILLLLVLALPALLFVLYMLLAINQKWN